MLGAQPSPPVRIVPEIASAALRATFQELLRGHLAEIEQGRLRLKIPRAVHLLERRPAMHFHFKPEIFLQLHGITRFEVPAEGFQLLPGEVAIMPKGLPHTETVSADAEPFRNMVIGFYTDTVSMHFAREAQAGKPAIERIGFYAAPGMQRIVDLTDALIGVSHAGGACCGTACRGLLMAVFSLLADLLDREPDPGARQDPERIFKVKWMVRDQIHNVGLSVKGLAEQLHCSPDYLSHTFHRETGETLIHYIHRHRVQGAIEALTTTELTISEISWACGFSDPGYFARVFKKFAGRPPGDFRRRHEENRRWAARQNRTVARVPEEPAPPGPITWGPTAVSAVSP